MFGAFTAGVPSFGDASWKQPVRAAQWAALPASTYASGSLTASANGALPAIDGVSLAVGDRLLLWLESSSFTRGIYTVASLGSAGTPWVLTRATDCDTADELVAGMSVFVLEGTVLRGVLFTAYTSWTPTSGVATIRPNELGQAAPGVNITPYTPNTDTPLYIRGDGTGLPRLVFGTTAPLADVGFYRSGAKVLQLDDGALGNATLNVNGTLAENGFGVAKLGATAQGIQSGRQAVGANIAAGAARTDTITLPTAYADANYTIVLTSRQGTILNGQCIMVVEGTPAAASFQVNTRNNDTVARQPTIHWLTIHD